MATILDENDLSLILKDTRGSHKIIAFYELYPELEIEAKAYALENAKQKKCCFFVENLAKFIDDRFYFYHGETFKKNENEPYIRSVESCRADLIKWGARWDSNSKRPYFEGHERDDVVQHRGEFIKYFINSKNSYYLPFSDENGILLFKKPNNSNATILISHDESFFRSGELPAKRWLFPEMAPFFNKGKGRSLMLSTFIVMHDTTAIFELDEGEWNEAIM